MSGDMCVYVMLAIVSSNVCVVANVCVAKCVWRPVACCVCQLSMAAIFQLFMSYSSFINYSVVANVVVLCVCVFKCMYVCMYVCVCVLCIVSMLCIVCRINCVLCHCGSSIFV